MEIAIILENLLLPVILSKIKEKFSGKINGFRESGGVLEVLIIQEDLFHPVLNSDIGKNRWKYDYIQSSLSLTAFLNFRTSLRLVIAPGSVLYLYDLDLSD